MRIVADRDRCIGVGHCVRTAPDLFDSADDGRVAAYAGPLPAGRVEEVRLATQLCPNAVLVLASEEDD